MNSGLNIKVLEANIELMKENTRLKKANNVLLDQVSDLLLDNNHYKRTETHYKKLIIDEQNKSKVLTEHIEVKNRIIESKDIVIEVEQNRSSLLQNQLDKYIEHINIGG